MRMPGQVMRPSLSLPLNREFIPCSMPNKTKRNYLISGARPYFEQLNTICISIDYKLENAFQNVYDFRRFVLHTKS